MSARLPDAAETMTEKAVTVCDFGDDCDVAASAVVGEGPDEPVRIGDGATIRGGTIVYGGVQAGDGFTTGHHALVRGGTTIGDDVLVGTQAVLDGDVDVGSNVSVQTGVYLPRDTTVGDDVFFGPYAVLTNDPYPVREGSEILGATVESGATIGANATVLPGVTVGRNAFVAAGALVTEDVPADSLAVGAPATHEPLPSNLEGGNAR